MDPITIGLFVMAVLWLIRRGAEDITAMVTGHEAPRVVRMRERRALSRLTVTEAVSVRIARFIAQGRDPHRERGPLRLYLSELWTDAWQDARDGHERRRRPQASAASSAPEPVVDDTDIVDAEIVEPDNNWGDAWDDPWEKATERAPDHAPTDTPAPDPAQAPLRKETPMSTVHVPGEAASPVQALAWADSRHDTNASVMEQLQYLMNFLKGKNLGPAAIATVGAVITAVDGATGSIRGAQAVYAEHVLAQQELTTDPALRDTLVGYLNASRS